MVNIKNKYKENTLLQNWKYADIKASDALTQTIHNEFKDVLTCINCFKRTFPLEVKREPSLSGISACIAYALKPFKD